jgi:hypothetical protein
MVSWLQQGMFRSFMFVRWWFCTDKKSSWTSGLFMMGPIPKRRYTTTINLLKPSRNFAYKQV